MKRKMNWVRWFISILFFIGIPSIVHADWGDILSKFQPYISLEEEFNDNIFLSAHNRVDDFITRIYPGLKFSTKDSNYGVDLDYRLGLVFYAKETNNDFVGHSGTLNAWYTLDRRLTFRVSDYLIRSEEPRELEYTPEALPIQYQLGTERTRSVYLRNVFEPSVQYQFGKEDFFSINYRNNFYDNQSRLYESSRENYINPKLAYWFDIRNGIVLEYGLTLGKFEKSPDLTGHMATARYIYRFDPRTSVFGDYTFLRRDFDSPGIDYDVHRPTIGIEHAFSPTLSVKAQLGYFWENPKKGSKTSDPYYDISFTQRAEKTTYTLLFQGGYREDYFTAQNLGFTKYHRGVGTIRHQLKERLTVGLSGSLERAKLGTGQRDWIYGIWGNASYQILKWLNLALEVSHREDHSNIDTSNYSEYRGIFRATATF
jgi:hypothetical protein